MVDPVGRPRQRLRYKLIAWFFGPTLLILAAVAALSVYTSRQITHDLVIERNQTVTRLLAAQLAGELYPYAQTLLIQADAGLSAPATPFEGGLIWLDAAGRIIRTLPPRPEALGRDLSAAAYFQTVRHTRQAAWSDIEAWGVDGEAMLLLAVPRLSGDGVFQGAVAGLIPVPAGPQTRNSDFYVGLFRTLGLTIDQNVYLIDRNGRAVLHSDTYRIGETLAGQRAIETVLAGTTDSLRTRNLTGQPVLLSLAPVPGTPWSLVTEEDWLALTDSSLTYQRWLLVLILLAALVPVVLVLLGSGYIIRPLESMTAAARAMADGDLSRRIVVHSDDELAVLGRQFNQMAAELEHSYRALEDRVAARTRELAALNTVATVVSQSLELATVTAAALDKTLHITDMDMGNVLGLVDPDSVDEPPRLLAHYGLSAAFLAQTSALPLAASLAAEALLRRQPVLRPVTAYEPGPMRRALEAEGMVTALSIPLLARDTVLGAMNLGCRRPRTFAAAELDLLAAIGRQVGVALENARLYHQVETTAAAAERSRLARELHDAVSQTLFSASLIADVLPRLWARDPREAARRLDEVKQLTRSALAEMRTLLLELRPEALARTPLPTLLRQLAEAIGGRAKLPIQVTIAGEAVLPEAVKLVVYRIAQEALHNIVKHASATLVELHLYHHAGGVHLHIADDGCGFDPATVSADHLGLRIMAERAQRIMADLEIDARPGRGSAITLIWMPALENTTTSEEVRYGQ